MAEPKFIPKNGQVDYTDVRYAPVVQCILKHGNKILLVKRSDNLRTFPGYWSGIAGYLDDKKDVKDKIYEELSEEAGISSKKVSSITLGNIVTQDERQYDKTFIIFPALIEVDSPEVKLDWEASEHRWLSPSEAKKLNLMPGFDKVLEQFYP